MSVPFASEISFNFPAPVWELHSWNDLLLVTTKDQDQLSTRFHLIRIGQNEMIFEDLGFDEEWWISVFLFNGAQVVFQVYNDTQDIEHRSAFCYDIVSEEVLWSVDGVKLQQVNSTTLRCTGLSDESDSFFMQVATGATIAVPMEEEASTQVSVPQTYYIENEHYALLERFLTKRDVQDFEEPIEYLEYKERIIFGLNFRKEHNYSLQLFVYDAKDGKRLFQTVLEHKMSGQAHGVFFIVEQGLIFVEEKHRLKICSLD